MEIEGVKAIADSSREFITWSLAVGGGTIGTLIGTSYKHATGKMKWIYFLFLPGWIELGLSFWYGSLVKDIYIGGEAFGQNHVAPGERLTEILDVFDKQTDCFYYALLIFGTWLAIYLMWWIFNSN